MEIVVHKTKFEAGDVVSGVLKVPTTGQLKASDVTIGLVGLTEVKWVPDAVYGMYQIVPPVALFETNKCLNLAQVVTDRDIITTKSGHEIPFEFRLPTGGIPSSFNSRDGAIEYRIVGVVKKSDGKEDEVDKKIQVFAPITHNLKVPVISTVEKDFGLLSLAHGKVILHAALVRKGHYPGETIVLHCDVNNESSVDVTPRATLYQNEIYLFGERHKGTQHHLTEHVVGKKVEKHSKGTEILAIKIPENLPLTIKTELISVKYFLHVTLDIPHALDLHVNLPLVLSTRSALDIHD